jgi:hypothetical protein
MAAEWAVGQRVGDGIGVRVGLGVLVGRGVREDGGVFVGFGVSVAIASTVWATDAAISSADGAQPIIKKRITKRAIDDWYFISVPQNVIFSHHTGGTANQLVKKP